jgi:hypothetical protein
LKRSFKLIVISFFKKQFTKKTEQQISEQDHIISSDFNVFQKTKNTNRFIWFVFNPIKVG